MDNKKHTQHNTGEMCTIRRDRLKIGYLQRTSEKIRSVRFCLQCLSIQPNYGGVMLSYADV